MDALMQEIYLAIGVFMISFGLFSLVIKDRFFMSEAILATVFGVLLSFIPSFSQFKIDFTSLTTLELSRLVLAIQCMAAGVQLRGNYVQKEWKSLVMLLGPVMIYMWLISSVGLRWILGLSWQTAFIIGACITPTDPVLANSIVKGVFAEKHVPSHLRLLISAESAVNDGLGTPLFLLPIYLSQVDKGLAIGEWVLTAIVYEVVCSVIIGIVIGLVLQKTLRFSQKYKLIDRESFLSFSFAFALFTCGALALIGMDDILACFIVGTVITWDEWFNEQLEESHIQEVIDLLINTIYFIYVGLQIRYLDFSVFGNVSTMILAALWVIFLRRLPIVMVLQNFIPVLTTTKESFFCGWFGPIGASAIFYAVHASLNYDADAEKVVPVVVFVVLTSVVIHGGTVGLFHIGIKSHKKMKQRNKMASKKNSNATVYSVELGDSTINLESCEHSEDDEWTAYSHDKAIILPSRTL